MLYSNGGGSGDPTTEVKGVSSDDTATQINFSATPGTQYKFKYAARN